MNPLSYVCMHESHTRFSPRDSYQPRSVCSTQLSAGHTASAAHQAHAPSSLLDLDVDAPSRSAKIVLPDVALNVHPQLKSLASSAFTTARFEQAHTACPGTNAHTGACTATQAELSDSDSDSEGNHCLEIAEDSAHTSSPGNCALVSPKGVAETTPPSHMTSRSASDSDLKPAITHGPLLPPFATAHDAVPAQLQTEAKPAPVVAASPPPAQPHPHAHGSSGRGSAFSLQASVTSQCVQLPFEAQPGRIVLRESHAATHGRLGACSEFHTYTLANPSAPDKLAGSRQRLHSHAHSWHCSNEGTHPPGPAAADLQGKPLNTYTDRGSITVAASGNKDGAVCPSSPSSVNLSPRATAALPVPTVFSAFQRFPPTLLSSAPHAAAPNVATVAPSASLCGTWRFVLLHQPCCRPRNDEIKLTVIMLPHMQFFRSCTQNRPPARDPPRLCHRLRCAPSRPTARQPPHSPATTPAPFRCALCALAPDGTSSSGEAAGRAATAAAPPPQFFRPLPRSSPAFRNCSRRFVYRSSHMTCAATASTATRRCGRTRGVWCTLQRGRALLAG
jgi:hypothetical protein